MTTPAPSPLEPDQIDERTYRILLAVIAAVAILLRAVWPVADQPWQIPLGINWHDEGAWTHNARNMALFGVWETDQWNPMYLAPVFNAFEYLSFSLFGVGLWQARLVSEALGVASVLFVAGAVRLAAGRTAGAAAAALMATNFVWVMWNRAALLETSMIAPMTAALYAYARADRSTDGRAMAWGILASGCAMLGFFSKSAAVFFLAAMSVVAAQALWQVRRQAAPGSRTVWVPGAHQGVLLGFVVSGAVAAAVFVIPYWQEFRFYNWQMTVTRKPTYSWSAVVDRASWFPVVHDFFTRLWVPSLLALGALFGTLARWRRASAVERLAAAWIVVGCAGLIMYDVGNERRFVFLVPPILSLAAIVLGRDRRLLAPETVDWNVRRLAAVGPLLVFSFYVLAGSAVRIAFAPRISPGVWVGAAVALAATAILYATWPRPARWLSGGQWSLRASVVLIAIVISGDVAAFVQWAVGHTTYNYQAMRALAGWLPPETVVHGKLASGLAYESRIKPVFVARGFANDADRLALDQVRYVLTYTKPYLGYEGRVMQEVLRSTQWRIIRRFRVAESTTGDDEAVLIEVLPRTAPAVPRSTR